MSHRHATARHAPTHRFCLQFWQDARPPHQSVSFLLLYHVSHLCLSHLEPAIAATLLRNEDGCTYAEHHQSQNPETVFTPSAGCDLAHKLCWAGHSRRTSRRSQESAVRSTRAFARQRMHGLGAKRSPNLAKRSPISADWQPSRQREPLTRAPLRQVIRPTWPWRAGPPTGCPGRGGWTMRRGPAA